MDSFTQDLKQRLGALRGFYYAASTYLFAMVSAFYGTLLGARRHPALVRVRSSRRAAGMLEYALIALIAVGIFVLLRDFFGRLFTRLTGNINDKLDTPNNSGL